MSTYRSQVVNGTKPALSDLGFAADIRYDVDDAAPIYIGTHVTNGIATSDADWKILKFTYSGSNVTRIQLAYGAWDNRTTLF